MKNLNSLIQILQKSQIEFVIVGGFSAVLHGSSMVTQDLDICIEFSKENLIKLRKTFAKYHPVHRMTPQKLSFLEHPENLKSLKNLYLETDVGVVDILGFVSGVGEFERVKKKAMPIELFGKPCFILSLEDLIKSKKFMGRPKDLMTIKELECLRKEK